MDFIRGASLCPGGKPIIALPSRTRRGEPRIVPRLKKGGGVVTTRAHVHYVVTEYGVADLYGRTLGERFRALRTRIAANGLIRADVEITPTPDKRPIAPEFGLLNSILGRLIEQAGDQLPQAMREPVDDADWLACRLAELLPLSLQERQILLEMDEPEQRLEELLQILPRFQKA